MSKMRRKPTLAELDKAGTDEAQQVDATADAPVGLIEGMPRGTIADVPVDADAQAQQRTQIAERESLAKVMVNEDTPRCPLCGSVKLTEMPMENFLRWRCDDCRKHFRNPATGRAA